MPPVGHAAGGRDWHSRRGTHRDWTLGCIALDNAHYRDCLYVPACWHESTDLPVMTHWRSSNRNNSTQHPEPFWALPWTRLAEELSTSPEGLTEAGGISPPGALRCQHYLCYARHE